MRAVLFVLSIILSRKTKQKLFQKERDRQVEWETLESNIFSLHVYICRVFAQPPHLGKLEYIMTLNESFLVPLEKW